MTLDELIARLRTGDRLYMDDPERLFAAELLEAGREMRRNLNELCGGPCPVCAHARAWDAALARLEQP